MGLASLGWTGLHRIFTRVLLITKGITYYWRAMLVLSGTACFQSRVSGDASVFKGVICSWVFCLKMPSPVFEGVTRPCGCHLAIKETPVPEACVCSYYTKTPISDGVPSSYVFRLDIVCSHLFAEVTAIFRRHQLFFAMAVPEAATLY